MSSVKFYKTYEYSKRPQLNLFLNLFLLEIAPCGALKTCLVSVHLWFCTTEKGLGWGLLGQREVIALE